MTVSAPSRKYNIFNCYVVFSRHSHRPARPKAVGHAGWADDGGGGRFGVRRSEILDRRPRVAFSKDGREWTPMKPILAEDHWLSVAKSLLPEIRALGIEELPKRVSAEGSRTPLRKQVWVQHQTLIAASSRGFSSTKRLLQAASCQSYR